MLTPLFDGIDIESPFYSQIFNRFWPYAYIHEIDGTALAAAVRSGQAETVTAQPDFGPGVLSATATPLGGGRFLVEYEVKNE